MPLSETVSAALTRCTFVGGTEHGKTRACWATREILVVVQSEPNVDAAKQDLKALLSVSHPKPQRQIYELVESSIEQGGKNVARDATYRLVEAP